MNRLTLPRSEIGLLVVGLFATIATGMTLFGQQTETKPAAFEAASIKINNAADARMAIRNSPGGRVSMTAVTLKQMIQSAYRVREFEIVGGPTWVQSDRFDVEAKADENYRSGD